MFSEARSNPSISLFFGPSRSTLSLSQQFHYMNKPFTPYRHISKKKGNKNTKQERKPNKHSFLYKKSLSNKLKKLLVESARMDNQAWTRRTFLPWDRVESWFTFLATSTLHNGGRKTFWQLNRRLWQTKWRTHERYEIHTLSYTIPRWYLA